MEFVTFGETENLITPRERRKRMSAWGEKEAKKQNIVNIKDKTRRCKQVQLY